MASDSDSKDGKNSEEGKGLLGDTLKKVFTAGVSAAFMTEESVRTYLAELKLPKEILNLLLQSAAKSKEEITNRISKEAISMLHKIDVINEASKFAENHKFIIKAEIDIVRKNPVDEIKPENSSQAGIQED